MVPTPERPRRVLFLCTGNSARSLLAEAILAREGPPRFRACSAGSKPTGHPHPLTLETLTRLGYETASLRSKSWDEFTGAQAPEIDIVITVCGNAAGEDCPVWKGSPVRVHWGHEDPAAFEGTSNEQRALFERTHDELKVRVHALIALELDGLSASDMRSRLQSIAADRLGL